jgi:hypothetical protein
VTTQLLLGFLTNHLLFTDELYYGFFNQLSFERVNEIIESSRKWKWLAYALIPILLLVKLLLVSICLSIGGSIIGVESGFKKFFTIILYTEFIFLFPVILKIIWFVFFDTDYTLAELQYFSPLSVFSFSNLKEIAPWFTYPLQLLNLFELLYWFALAYLLKDVLGKSFKGSLGFVASTYGIGLVIWVVLVMFLVVTIS